MIKNLVFTIVVAGSVLALLMEFIKQQYKGQDKTRKFPKSIGLICSAGLSVLASICLVFLFRGYPNFSPLVLDGNWFVVVPYSLGLFLFQYFVSMEIVKGIVHSFLKRAGIEYKE